MSDKPLYVTIRDDLKAQIDSKQWPPDHQLPSEAALADQYGVTRMTVRQALEQLTSAGLLVRRHGLGTFVTHRSPDTHRTLNQLTTFANEVGVEPDSVTTTIYAQELTEPTVEAAEFLLTGPAERVVRLLRLRAVNAHPVALQESWLRLVTLPSILREPLIDGSLYRTLEAGGVHMKWASQEMTADAATADQAAILNIAEGAPLIATTRRTYGDNDAAIELAQSWTRTEYPILIHLAVPSALPDRR